MAVDFDRAFSLVVGIEGGYVNDPDDPGGETKYGICKRSYPDLDIYNLTLDKAKEIYYNDYWVAARCDKMPAPLNGLVFDAAINQGVKPAIMVLQKTLGVAQDGLFGPATQKALASAGKETAALYQADRALRYIGTRNFDKYGRGWLKRLFVITGETQLPWTSAN